MTDDAIDTAKLSRTATQMAQNVITDSAKGVLGNLSTAAGYAKDVGVNGSMIDNFLKTITDLFQKGLSFLGISMPDITPATSTASADAPAAPSNPAAAQAAAQAAAAKASAANGTHVADAGAPANTPAAPKTPRSKA